MNSSRRDIPPAKRERYLVWIVSPVTKYAWSGSLAGRCCYLSGGDIHLFVTPCNRKYLTLKWFYKKYIYRLITRGNGIQNMTLSDSDLPVSIVTPSSQDTSRNKRCSGARRRDSPSKGAYRFAYRLQELHPLWLR